MRTPAPHAAPVALTIAGSDSGGGAGVQADIQTMAARGVFGTSAVTSVTAQHTRGVESTHVLPTAAVTAQVDAVLDDFDVRAAKTGLLATEGIVRAVTEVVRDFDGRLVVDPVMVATSGDRLLDPGAEAAYADLLAEATLVTPNADEASVLADVDVTDPESAAAAGRELVAMGADAALVTGGHVGGGGGGNGRDDGDDGGGDDGGDGGNRSGEVVDVLVIDGRGAERGDEGTVRRFAHPRIDAAATHGSGCTLSAAVAADLARGVALPDAVARGTDLLQRAIRHHYDVGRGPGAVHHLAGLRSDAARDDAVETVEAIRSALRTLDFAPLVPEVGTNVAVATPLATGPDEVAGVEGRITRTVDGPRATRAARMGASDHLARFLVACREHDPALRCAINCRHDAATREALSSLDWTVASYDRRDQPDDVRGAEGSTMRWAANEVFDAADATPDAVTDPGAVGKEPMCKLLATDAEALVARVRALLDARPA